MLWAALNSKKKEPNNTGIRPTHGRSRQCGCVSMFCFHDLQWLFLFSSNQRLDEFAFFFLSALTSSVLLSSTALRFVRCIFVMLDLHDEGSSKQTCMVCVLSFLQNTIVNRHPHISETYPLVRRIEQARQSLRTAAFCCLEFSK